MKRLRQLQTDCTFHRRKIKMTKFSRENLDESLVIHQTCLTFHCGTLVLYSISSYFACYIEIKL